MDLSRVNKMLEKWTNNGYVINLFDVWTLDFPTSSLDFPRNIDGNPRPYSESYDLHRILLDIKFTTERKMTNWSAFGYVGVFCKLVGTWIFEFTALPI